MGHYTYAELDQYLHGDLPWLRRLLCRFHLKRCPCCASLLAHVKSANDMLYGKSSPLNPVVEKKHG